MQKTLITVSRFLAQVKSVGRTRIVSIFLVTLAVLNFLLLDGMAGGLVSRVYDKHEEIGSNWILLQQDFRSAETFDPYAASGQLSQIEGVRQVFPFWMVRFMVGAPDTHTYLYVLSPDSSFDEHPQVFLPYEDREAESSFVKNDLHLAQGAHPKAQEEVALERVLAEQLDVTLGDEIPVIGEDVHGNPGVFKALTNATVVGIYDRFKQGNPNEDTPVAILGHNESFVEQLTGNGSFGAFPRPMAAFTAALPDLFEVVHRVASVMTAKGAEVEIQVPSWLSEDSGGVVMVEPNESGVVLVMYTNAELLLSAITAAERAGTWFRLLSFSAFTMAAFGVAFVTAADIRLIRRESGILQAVGFGRRRLLVTWLRRSLQLGVPAAVLAMVFALPAAHVAASYGLPYDVAVGRLLVLSPMIALLLASTCSLPAYLAVLRKGAVENLRRANL